ncbi:hypothetical protein ACJMK2_004336 [Sinanodonta woodiana]|uniref:Peptidase M12B domain-containing protein n=1 Tax=Sinanodonta woodiana TaxID=1069815 RepID=A0ABD3Y0Y2_SINWO
MQLYIYYYMLLSGLSHMNGVCDTGKRTSVIESHMYSRTVQTAAHELAHNLGADHDGEGDAKACRPEDGFIMTPHGQLYDEFTPYSRNPWIFSRCSVESFKKKLRTKSCVKIAGAVFNILEWSKFLQKQAGDVFTPDKQCRLAYGPNSQFVGTPTEDICHILKCTKPATRQRRRKFIFAARGTMCGENKWCIEGRCIPKS